MEGPRICRGRVSREEDHPFADDLDLFGEGSLFELLAVTRTGIGRATLADWMQDACHARRGACPPRGSGGTEGPPATEGSSPACWSAPFSPCEKEIFSKWLESPPLPFPAWFRVAAGVLPLVWSGAAIVFAFGFVSKGAGVAAVVASLAAEGALAWRCRRSVRTVLGGIGTAAIDLKIIRNLFKLMLNGGFASPKLKEIAGALHTPDALGAVGRLERLVRFLEWRQVEIFSAVFWALLWGTNSGWQSSAGEAVMVRVWDAGYRQFGGFEALTALACYSFEHPHYPFPELTEGAPLLDAGQMGHPLLDPLSACQRNDVRLAQDRRLLIVSGSNMSGKSTLLRGAGVNVVLALMGAPVRASHMTVSDLRISASIRVQDSLLRGRSHFYAEVSKIRDSIARAESSPVLFLIDEILSGTNSRDRRIAAEAVIRALIARNAIGMITTHDLALTQIAHQELRAENVHFSDQVDSGGLEFDYRLRPGVLRESNALALIRTLGISV